jgi:hypothetical protein
MCRRNLAAARPPVPVLRHNGPKRPAGSTPVEVKLQGYAKRRVWGQSMRPISSPKNLTFDVVDWGDWCQTCLQSLPYLAAGLDTLSSFLQSNCFLLLPILDLARSLLQCTYSIALALFSYHTEKLIWEKEEEQSKRVVRQTCNCRSRAPFITLKDVWVFIFWCA